MKTMSKKLLLKVLVMNGVAVLMLSACSPRVMTEVTMTYPARTAEEVTVFDVGDTVPNNSVALGKVAVVDRWITTNCGYDRMLSLAKEKTAEIGGNGLLLTQHTEPGFWGSNCHQLMGTMLMMNDRIIDPTQPNPVMEGVKRDAEELARTIEERTPPTNTFKVNFGPSCIVSEIQSAVGTYKSLWGWDFAAEFQHSWRSGVGVGANVQYFFAKYDDVSGGPGYEYYIMTKQNFTILYLGPTITWGSKLSKNWLLNVELGLGYANVNDSYQSSSGLGLQWKMGIDYVINKQWGIGIEANSIATYMKKPDGLVIPDDKHYGFNRVNILAGVRYYF